MVTVLLSFFAVVATGLIGSTGPFQVLNLQASDWFFLLRGPVDLSDSPVVLIAIDDQADQEFPEPWPWPRSYHARLIENLNKAGAKAIGFDVTMVQPDEHSPHNDSLLADALLKHGNVVLAGDIRSERRAGVADFVQYVPPHFMFRQNNPNPWGFASNPLDLDGFIRRYRIVQHHLGSSYHPLGLELIRIYLDLDTLRLKQTPSSFDLGFVSVPRFGPTSMIINYHGPPGSFLQFSYDQILDDGNFLLDSDIRFLGYSHPEEKDFGTFDDPDNGLLQSGILKDKIVIVGATMPELHDFHRSPLSEQFPGFEIHANAIQTILDESFIRPISGWPLLLLIVMTVFFISTVTVYRGVITGFFVMLLLGVLLLIAAAVLFLYQNMRLDLVYPMVALVAGYMTSTSYSFVFEQLEKRRIRTMFGSYVAPEVVNEMIESGKEPQLGGSESYMTAFFSDIQSFSSFSEILQPKQLVDLINEYLSEMTDILNEERGTLDKYIGDAIVAFFGAPVPVDDHALRACVTSQRILLKQKELCHKWEKDGRNWPIIVSQMHTRIGINTGLMVTGNMGSTRRFNYTMMGDNVNLAARCESGARTYGVYTMVTEETRNEALAKGDDCVFRYLDKTIVAGRSKPVHLYEIMGLRTQLNPVNYECLELFEKGISEYQKQNLDQALVFFRESARLEIHQPGTPGIETNPSFVMIDRCRFMKKNPPGDDWNGIFVMIGK